MPLVDDMLFNRQQACERINSMFGTSISVEKNSAWLNKTRESEAELEIMEDQAEGGDEGDSKPADSNSG